MRGLCACLALGVGFGQTFSATGNVDFSLSTNWVEGFNPLSSLSPNLATTIATNAVVTVTSASAIAVTRTLNFGADAANTTLIATADFTVNALNFANGRIKVAAGKTFFCLGALKAIGNATANRVIEGGTVALALTGSISVDPNVSLTFQDTIVDVNGRTVGLGPGGWAQFSGSTSLKSDTTFSGSGAVAVDGQLVSNVADSLLTTNAVTFNTGAMVKASGSIEIAGNSNVEFRNDVVVNGSLSTTGTGKFDVQSTTVWFGGASASFGGGFSLSSSSSWLSIESGTTTVKKDATISGSGGVTVGAILQVDNNVNWAGSTGTLEVRSGGDVRVKAGVSVVLPSVNVSSNAHLRLGFNSDKTFNKLTVNGALILNGNIVVNVPNGEPAVVVVLATAASISGTFSASVTATAAVGRRLLASGTVVVNGTNLEYHPGTGSSGSPAATAECFIAILSTAVVVMWL